MITAIVQYRLPPSIGQAACAEHFRRIAPGFRDVPGLIRKQFIYAEDGWAGGVYLWQSRADAEAFRAATLPSLRRSDEVLTRRLLEQALGGVQFAASQETPSLLESQKVTCDRISATLLLQRHNAALQQRIGSGIVADAVCRMRRLAQ